MQALKALVIIMGVLIVVGTTVVVVTIYNRMTAQDEPPPTAGGAAPSGFGAPESLPAFGTAEVSVPDGCRVMEMVPAGERLLLRLGSIERCNRILVVDLRSGALLGSIALTAPQPESQP